LKRDFSFLQKLKGEITSRKSIIKIDAGYIFYNLEENQTFVDYEKLKYYLIDLSLVVRSIFHLFHERNSTRLEEYFKLYKSNKFNLSDDNLRSNVIRAIKELKSKKINVTQKAIAEKVGLKRTTLIERCKKEAFDLSSLIKAFKYN
jgi:DNA-binding XRE family transcriptional regulator